MTLTSLSGHRTTLSIVTLLCLIFTLPCRGEAHAWRGQTIVLFVTFEIRGNVVHGTVGLPRELLSSTLPSLGRDLRAGFHRLESGDKTWLNQLQSQLVRDLKIIDQKHTQTLTLKRIDLITPRLKSREDLFEIERPTIRVDQIDVEAHTGSPEAMIIKFEAQLSRAPSELRILWQSSHWFARERQRRSRPRSLTSRVAPGVIIDSEQLIPIRFTPIEPEVIWRSSTRFSQTSRPKEQKITQGSRQSWWSWFWGQKDDVSPSTNTLKQRFIRLHRQIYSAFDHEQDEAIYDALQTCLSGELLGDIFEATYRSLILRDQGGARAKVTHVIPLSTKRMTQDEWPQAFIQAKQQSKETLFVFEHQWRVAGEVTHWDHTHRRVIDFRAIYAMADRPEGWRIVYTSPREQRRRPELEGGL